MRNLVYLLAIVLMALSPIGVHAEEINEITLTVSSDGPTKDEAVKNALRLAIEQAYGAFVSANTTILNDELVKDEIVTITHGAIKEFKEVAAAQLSDNRYSITVQATVSLPNLITYAKNHGSECEFAGKTFAMELKLFELEKENERKALYNLIPIIEQICKNTMHWELEIGEPKIPRMYKEISNAGENLFYVDPSSHYYRSFCINETAECSEYELLDEGKYPEVYEFFEKVVANPSDFCGFDVEIYWLPNGEMIEFAEVVKEYLRQLSLDEETYASYQQKGFDVGELMDIDSNWFETDIYKPYVYRSRLDKRTLEEWYTVLMDKILEIKCNFEITDVKGDVSDFYPKKFYDMVSHSEDYSKNNYTQKIGNNIFWLKCQGSPDIVYGGTGLFNQISMVKTYNLKKAMKQPFTDYVDVEKEWGLPRYRSSINYKPLKLKKGEPGWRISVIAPMSAVEKFTSFKIKAKY